MRGALLQDKQLQNKNKTKTRVPFKRTPSKDAHCALLRCDTNDHLEEKQGERDILPKHVRPPGICETLGLCLILHSKSETGKCGHDSTFKSAPPVSQQIVWALLEEKRGKNHKSVFPRGMAVSSTGFEKKQPDPSGERMEEHGELHLSGSDWACFVLLLSEDSKQGRARGVH